MEGRKIFLANLSQGNIQEENSSLAGIDSGVSISARGHAARRH